MIAVVICLLTTGLVYAAERGTPEEAVAMVGKAAAFLKANGKDKAFAAFNDPKGQFIHKDLYVFIIDWDGVILAHGVNKSLINKPTAKMKDSHLKLSIEKMIYLAKNKGEGWAVYIWTNPLTKNIEKKSSYVQRVDGENFLIGCGVYK